MTGSRILWFAAAGVALVLAYAAAPKATPAPVPSSGDKWDYGEFHYLVLPDRTTADGFHLPAETRVRWITTEEEITAADWEDMAKKLKVPLPNINVSSSLEKLRVFNRLGADGWELATYHPKGPLGGTDVWTFKRKVGR